MGTLPKSGEVQVTAMATPDQVWALLADVTRAGEWSHENKGGEWFDGATSAAPGAHFRGLNKNGKMKWSRECEVLVADAPHVISWRTIPTWKFPDSTRWTYEIDPTADGCRITQRFEVLKINPIVDRIFYALIPAHRDRSAALEGDLRDLGEAAAKSLTAPR